MLPKKKLDIILRRVVENCSHCNGRGCGQCDSKMARYRLYSIANIPYTYWPLSMANFKGDPRLASLIKKMGRDIDGVYERGDSIAMVGNLGTGKTYSACALLKEAVSKGYSGLFLNMSDIINDMMGGEDKDLLKRLIEVDFLVIDEFDARFIFPSEKTEQLFGQTMEYLLRNRFQNGMPTFVCSNASSIDEVLPGEFGKALASLRSRFMKVIPVAGKDFRKSGSKA